MRLTKMHHSEHMKRTIKIKEGHIRRLQKERQEAVQNAEPVDKSRSMDSLLLERGLSSLLKMTKEVRKTGVVPDPSGRPPSSAATASESPGTSASDARSSIEGQAGGSSTRPSTAHESRRSSKSRRPSSSSGSERVIMYRAHANRASRVNSSEDGVREIASDGVESEIRRRPSSEADPAARSLESGRSSVPSSMEIANVSSRAGSSRVSRTCSTDEESFERPSDAASIFISRRPSPDAGPSQGLVGSPANSPDLQGEVEIDGDFLHVQPAQQVLKVVTSEDYQRLSGQIQLQDGSWQQVTGVLEPEQTFNFMTASRASQLGLMNLFTDEMCDGDEQRIELPNGRKIRPVGMLRVSWRAPSMRRIPLWFYVFHYDMKRDIVLGKSFVMKRDHYERRVM